VSTHDPLEEQKAKILAWISNIPYKSHHKDISERRLHKTGKWLFEKEEYRLWKSSSVSTLLLLRGIRKSKNGWFAMCFVSNMHITLPAGAGKTFTA